MLNQHIYGRGFRHFYLKSVNFYTEFSKKSQISRQLPQDNYINYRLKNLKIFDFWLDREATTPTTLDFSKKVRDRDRYRKSTTSTTGQKI